MILRIASRFFVCLAFANSIGFAAQFVVETDNRSIYLQTPGVCNEYDIDGFTCIDAGPRIEYSETPAGGTFDDSLSGFEAGASQSTEVGPTAMSGTGDIYAGLDAVILYGTAARSDFDVTFSVTEDIPVRLSGFLDASWGSDISVKLSDADGVLYEVTGFDVSPTDEFVYEPTLLASGSYQLELSAVVAGETDYNEDSWQFNMSIVPEPNGLIVGLVGALLGMAGLRRHRQSHE